jgi:hypothetical protein
MTRALTVMLFTLAIACVPAMQPLSVREVLRSPIQYDGQRIQVRGILSPRHDFLNLFTKDKQQCLGLLLTSNERATLTGYSERKVSLIGSFRAEGCGRDGICDEHLCGPGVLTNVSLISKEARPLGKPGQ